MVKTYLLWLQLAIVTLLPAFSRSSENTQGLARIC
jgi:hypothetical protein